MTPVSAPGQRRRIRPTRALAGLSLILIAMALAASNYQSNGAWLILFLTTSLVGVSALATWRNLDGVSLNIDTPPMLAAGSPGTLTVHVHCAQPRWGLRVSVVEPGEVPAKAFAAASDSPDVVILASRARGLHRISDLRLRTTWPFGLFLAEQLVPVDLTLIVHPIPQGLSWDKSHGHGNATEPIDFAGVRPWQTGDHPRHIDWRAAARREDQAPPVKMFTGGGSKALWLDWTATDDAHGELRLGQLTRWVLELHQQGQIYGMRLPGHELQPATGPVHLRACLMALAGWHLPVEAPGNPGATPS